MTQNNLTPEQMANAVSRIAELDEKRTQGEWSGVYPEEYAGLAWCKIITDAAHVDATEADMEIAATAPLMAQVIRQLWAEREQQRAAMVQAREAFKRGVMHAESCIGIAYPDQCTANFNWLSQMKDAKDALDAALGGV